MRRVGGGNRHSPSAPNTHRRTRTSLTLTRTATGWDTPPSGAPDSENPGDFREFTRDANGNVIDSDGNVMSPPENGWVAEMEKEWAATGYDDRFFDDDWDEINEAEKPGNNVTAKTEPVYPFKDIKDSEWKETVRWEDEAFDDMLGDPIVESGPIAGPGPMHSTSPPSTEPSPSSTIRSSKYGDDGDILTKKTKEFESDLTEAQEAAVMGFSSGLDSNNTEAEPEGPPCVLLAGFKAEELPRVRELLDELGGHDVPVVPVAQSYLKNPLLETLSILEPNWENPRNEEEFNKGGEYGSQRCVIFSGLDKGEMATFISAIEARGLPRLVTVVITSENCEQSLGESLALAVQESRSEKKRKEEVKNLDVRAALLDIEEMSKNENLTPQELVDREIERQDALAADEAAAFAARDERAALKEAHMEKLKREYVEKARARAAAEAAIGNEPSDDLNPAGWPTIEDVEEFSANADRFEMEDVMRASGADGDALEAMVRDALARGEVEHGGESVSDDVDDVVTASSMKVDKPPIATPSEPLESPLESVEGREVEIDPTRWAERVDGSYDVSVTEARAVQVNDASDTTRPVISEPIAAQPNPESSRPAVRDFAETGGPPERNDVSESVGTAGSSDTQNIQQEPTTMTRRMLRELAMRRGVSYQELLEKAEASGVELPEE